MKTLTTGTLTVSIKIDFDIEDLISGLEERELEITNENLCGLARAWVAADREDFIDYNKIMDSEVVDRHEVVISKSAYEM